MHALGNDFVVIDGTEREIKLRTDWIRRVGDRHKGIGFDQLLYIKASETNSADFELLIYNNDGSPAQQCGNGTLCVARFVREENLSTKPSIAFKTLGGIVEAAVLDTNADDGVLAKAELGIPTIDPACVPFVAALPDLEYEIDLNLEATPTVRLIPIGMGNPHAVVFITGSCGLHFEAVSNAIQSHERFPESVNVEFVELVDPNFVRLRVFERGVGETLACGTGACAAVTAARLAKRVESRVSVQQVGGTVVVDWAGPDHPISLTAATSRVFDGEIEFD